MLSRVTGPIVVCLTVLAAGPAAALAHEGIMHIGRTAAGTLVITDFDFDDLFTLEPAAAPLSGWASHEPMFRAVDADDPGADVFALDAAAKVSIQVILFSPGLRLMSHDLGLAVSQPGQSLSLGALPFTEHFIWHLDSSDPAFDPSAGEWSAEFRLLDAGPSSYAASEAHTLRLTIPSPSGAAIFAAAGLMARRRKR